MEKLSIINLQLKNEKNKINFSPNLLFSISQRWSRGHKAQGQGHKKSEEKDRLLEDRPYRGQGQECLRPRTQRASVLKKESSRKKISNFARNFGRRKKSLNFGPFLTNQKIALPSAEDRAFSWTCRLRGQGLDPRGQEVQNVSSRQRTSSRTPRLHLWQQHYFRIK